MTLSPLLINSIQTIGVIVLVMAVVALVEAVIPLHARVKWNRDHLVPNLSLTLITFVTNLCFNTALVLTLVWLHSKGFGLFNNLDAPAWLQAAIVVLGLDFSFYAAHRAMHRFAFLWRFHVIHHSDPAVDVTTTIRQHPGESVIRYVFMAAAVFALGASPVAFAIYRSWSALNGLSEHCNVRVPIWLDSFLSLLIVTPNTHKVHHSRDQRFTDTNYSNISTIFDRMFSTFTPSRLGINVAYGLDGYDNREQQTLSSLLMMPLRRNKQAPRQSIVPIPAP